MVVVVMVMLVVSRRSCIAIIVMSADRVSQFVCVAGPAQVAMMVPDHTHVPAMVQSPSAVRKKPAKGKKTPLMKRPSSRLVISPAIAPKAKAKRAAKAQEECVPPFEPLPNRQVQHYGDMEMQIHTTIAPRRGALQRQFLGIGILCLHFRYPRLLFTARVAFVLVQITPVLRLQHGACKF